MQKSYSQFYLSEQTGGYRQWANLWEAIKSTRSRVLTSSLFVVQVLANFAWLENSCLALDIPMITNYRDSFFIAYDNKENLNIVIRSFTIGEVEKVLAVDPHNFETHILDRETITTPKRLRLNISALLENTPYGEALKKYSSPPFRSHNYGIQNSGAVGPGVYLTIDMCPSSKAFEQEFFDTLKNRKQVDVGISLSGLWAVRHPEEFDWLIKQHVENKLKITWINHTFSHGYSSRGSFTRNELYIPKAVLASEVFSLEKLLIEKGQTPSVFFRFPGLISSEETVLKLVSLGLLPIGSDAWLAKGQKPQNGCIILVHGNSNEHHGIELMMRLLSEDALKLLPLADAFKAALSK